MVQAKEALFEYVEKAGGGNGLVILYEATISKINDDKSSETLEKQIMDVETADALLETHPDTELELYAIAKGKQEYCEFMNSPLKTSKSPHLFFNSFPSSKFNTITNVSVYYQQLILISLTFK